MRPTTRSEAAGFEPPLWRALSVFRIASLGYAFVLILQNYTNYEHPVGGWVVFGVMAAWTGYALYAYADPARRRWPLLITDLAVAAGCLLATAWVEKDDRLATGAPTLPVTWIAAPVLAWAVSGGKRRGALAAALLAPIDLLVRLWLPGDKFITQSTINGVVLLFLAAIGIGHVAKLASAAEERLQLAVELEAATRERERLARGIHDSVLQVLALVQRRGASAGGEAAELGRLAGEQEVALRALLNTASPVDHSMTDVRSTLMEYGGANVTVSTPATPVQVSSDVGREIAAAVREALDNVQRHCGADARVWVLLECENGEATVSVRDDGPGIAGGRLERAAADGRLGIAQSIRGRIHDLGGKVTITSAPGQGTEIEMVIPFR